MANTGTGLFDSEASVDRIGRFTKISAKPDLLDYLVSHAVLLWFGEVDGTTFARAIDRRSKEVSKLPKPLFNIFVDIASKKVTSRGSRTPEHTKILGSNRDGYRVQPLFDMPEAGKLMGPMAELVASKLDKTFKSKKTFAEEPLTELGIVLELTNAHLYPDPARVAAWEKGFMEMSARTTEDREHWDAYVERVKPLFSMLAAPATARKAG